MAMTVAALLFIFGLGMVIGVFFFGGLWLTVRRIPESRHPGLLSLGSFFTRAAVSLLAFYYVTGGHWKGILACLAGFFLMRILFTHLLNPGRNLSKPSEKRA
jgi:F1F0 ATPase subunit 2